jgi:cell wall-associated NlpC family hydrolase
VRASRVGVGAAVVGILFAGAMAALLVASLAVAGGPGPTTSGLGRADRSVPASADPGPAGPEPVGRRVAAVIAFARSQLGAPYQWGGAGPDSWDCSGLVMMAYEAAKLRLPHNAQAQYEATADATVPLDQLHPGDLVFFGAGEAAIGHVGIYVGDGEMIDAPHTGAFVRLESISWSDLLVATRPLRASVATG